MNRFHSCFSKAIVLIATLSFTLIFILLVSQDKAVALVNGTAIRESDLAHMQKNAENVSRAELINSAIYDLLAYQEAELLGIVVEKDELVSSLEKIKNGNSVIYNKIINDHGSEDAYLEALKYNHLYRKYQEHILNASIEKLNSNQQREKYFIDHLDNLYTQADIIIY